MTEQTRPAPYLVADRKEWIVSDDPGIEGFAIYVRTSITNVEQRELTAKHDEIAGPYTEHYYGLPREQRDPADSPRQREKILIAPYVYDWNAVGFDGVTDEPKPLPAPRDAGPDVLECIGPAELSWLLRVLILGYCITGKAGLLPTPSGPTGSTPAPVIAPEPAELATRRTRRTS